MNRIIRSAVIGVVGVMGISSAGQAAPFDPKTVSSDAKWVVHIDVDAMSKTDTWKLVQPKLENNAKYAKGKRDIERVGQLKLPDDLHDVTLFGPTVGEKEAVVIIRANVNPERLKTLVSLNETYSASTVGGHQLHSWDDKGKTMFSGFAGDGRIVIGQSKDEVVAALDTIAGKLDPLKNAVLAPQQTNAGMLVYVAGDQLGEIGQQAARSPMIQKLKSAWITVTEDPIKGLKVKSQIVADDEKTATNVKGTIDGLKAAVSFAGQDDPDALLVSEAVLDLTATATGNNIDIDWNVPIQNVSDLLERATGDIQKNTK